MLYKTNDLIYETYYICSNCFIKTNDSTYKTCCSPRRVVMVMVLVLVVLLLFSFLSLTVDWTAPSHLRNTDVTGREGKGDTTRQVLLNSPRLQCYRRRTRGKRRGKTNQDKKNSNPSKSCCFCCWCFFLFLLMGILKMGLQVQPHGCMLMLGSSLSGRHKKE